MSNKEVTELTWKNGQLAMHELGGIFSQSFSFPEKPTWHGSGLRGDTAGDTLESVVDQATYYSKQSQSSIVPLPARQLASPNMGSVVASNKGGKWAGPQHPKPRVSGLTKKRTREIINDHESGVCGSINNDTTLMTWASHESPRSGTRTKTTTDDDSAYHCGSENQEVKSETGRSYTTRKGRAAVVHNQSERRRRDRINQKMKALQKLVPNARKTDKASMLDEVIEYLKQLQAQIQMMSNARFMPQIMMQQQLQMSLMARMGLGMGMGMGMLDPITMAHGTMGPQMIHPAQVATSSSSFVPQVIPEQMATTSGSNLRDPYSALLAQSMSIDMYNRMATLQRQQQQQISAQPGSTQTQLS